MRNESEQTIYAVLTEAGTMMGFMVGGGGGGGTVGYISRAPITSKDCRSAGGGGGGGIARCSSCCCTTPNVAVPIMGRIATMSVPEISASNLKYYLHTVDDTN